MGSIDDSNGQTNGYSNGNTNGHLDLPDKNSPHIQLVVATEQELYDQQIANSSEWKGALSLEAYLRREVHLVNQELTRNGGFTGWALVYQAPDSNSQRQVLCGCETLRKKALVYRDGKVEETIAHAVGSVFCPPKYRGKGYAGRMMRELGKRLASWQSVDGKGNLFSVLFSDIGKQFYAKHGWQPFPSAHVSLQPTRTASKDLSNVRYLKYEDLPKLCEVDQSLIRRRLEKSKVIGRTQVANLPDVATMRWHHAREEFVAKELFGRCPEVKGAMVGEPGSRVWCYWTRVWTNPQEEAPNTLHILRLVVEDESFSDFDAATEAGATKQKETQTANNVATLFAAAQVEAESWGMKEIQIWNPTSTTLAAARLIDGKAAVEHREKESIASLQWYGEGSWQDVNWIENQKYGWC